MSAQILTLMKYGLLVLLYLYFARVMHTVWVELRPTGKLRATEETKGKRGAARGGRPADKRSHNQAAAAGAAGAAAGAAAAKSSTGEHHHKAAKQHKPAPKHSRHGSGKGEELTVVEPANLAGMKYPITSRELTIGRAPGCGITVDDSFVSSLHARLAHTNNQTLIEDLGSRNGTYVNEKRISNPTVLKSGDRVRVGSVIMELR